MSTASAPIPANELFLNVRRAYRLLHDYQCMVRDAVHYIASQLNVIENGAWARFGGADVRSGYTYLRQSAWDWLPMVLCEFHFLKSVGDSNHISLSFFVISDSGFIDGENDDKENLSSYTPVERSSTRFAFILREGHWDPFPFMQDKVLMRAFIKPGGSLPDALVKAGCVAKCYDMSSICSPSEADRVVQDIITCAQAGSWPIERRKRQAILNES